MESHGLPELNEIYEYFMKNFCTHTFFIVKTNYVPLSDIRVVFRKEQLHHLLGLHKVTNNLRPSKIDKLIASNKLTLDSIKNHSNFNDIRYRIAGFYSIGKMFLSPGAEICLVAKDLKRNSMNVDVIFFNEWEDNSIMVLGLRRAKDSLIFYPTTLYKTKHDKFTHLRKTKIIKIEPYKKVYL